MGGGLYTHCLCCCLHRGNCETGEEGVNGEEVVLEYAVSLVTGLDLC